MENDRKWVYLSYVLITALVAFIIHKAIVLGLGIARVPNVKVLEVIPASGLAGIVIASVAAIAYFRKPNVNAFSLEVLQELKKVTWPPKKTTYMSTIVVIVVVVIVSAILGVFDWVTNYLVTFILQS